MWVRCTADLCDVLQNAGFMFLYLALDPACASLSQVTNMVPFGRVARCDKRNIKPIQLLKNTQICNIFGCPLY